MADLIPKQKAQVLSTKGFYRHWKMLFDTGTMTRKEAYYATEALHMEVDEDGQSKYVEFMSFDSLARKIEKRLAKQAAQLV